MKSQKFLSFIIMMVMCSMMLAHGQARDPKTGRFISKKAASTQAFNKMHPRDPKTGRFIKKSAVHTSMPMVKHGSFMKSHGTPLTPHKMPLTSHMSVPAKKPGMMSKIKAMLGKKKKP